MKSQKNPHVAVTIDGATARLRVARMGGEIMIGLSKASQSELGVQGGDVVEATIAVDTAERTVDVPPELAEALESAGLRAQFDALAPSRRKEAARQVAEAKAEATKQRRVAKIVAGSLTETAFAPGRQLSPNTCGLG
ncbi:YdeI/OmpD-associated family protein [Ruania alba]|uniref:Uncharacterized protein n=1 Tax=Ruania alba TaxID=648782 RepID=A0A1H5MZU8_9MICO|nr:YdeI/OmpD-associated family protein [Ruania alba]SEE94855.1 protein of unknown function [Ruania alba]